MGSPYPLHYTLRWPYYYMRPSIKNHTKMLIKPIEHHFVHANRSDYCRLVFCGDIMLTQNDKLPLLHNEVRELINSSDLFIGNCEAPVGDHQIDQNAKYHLIYHMPEKFLSGIIGQLTLSPKQILLSVANNHSGDKDRDAFFKTLEIFEKLGITPLGHYNATNLPLSIINFASIKIGFSSWTHWMNREVFARNKDVARTDTVLDINWEEVKNKKSLDTLIGLPHWEYEFQHFPKKNTRKLASSLISTGFDLLVGAHPHTLQPMEWFDKGICAYSLGNFCGLGLAWPVRLIPILEVRLGNKDSNKGKTLGYILHYFVQVNSKDKMEILPLRDVSQTLREKLTKRLGLIFQLEAS